MNRSGSDDDGAYTAQFLTVIRATVRRLLPGIMEAHNAPAHNAPARQAKIKSDGSFVTDTDQAVEAEFLAALRIALPGLPVLAEESIEENVRAFNGAASDFYAPFMASPYQIVIDPIDGTKNFVEGQNEFCIAAALTRRHADGVWPIAGVVAIPTEDRMYWSNEKAAFSETISSGIIEPLTRSESINAPVSVSSTDRRWLEREKLALRVEWISSGSSVHDMIGTVSGRLQASLIGTQRLWDIAAPLAIAERLNLVLRDAISGEEIRSIRAEDLSSELHRRPWGLDRHWILMAPTTELSDIFG